MNVIFHTIQMDSQFIIKINRVLKYLITIGLIVLVILSIVYKYDSCNKCSFKIENKKIGTNEFLQLYKNKCLTINKTNLDLTKFPLHP